MKALTVCQPYAHLICLPETDPRHKRVENRTWFTNYRGHIYIHAGKSREWLSNGRDVATPQDNYRIPTHVMAFGAVVAVVNLVDCVRHADIEAGKLDAKYPWLRTHEHAEGPFCWILEAVTPVGPWPWRGAQGLFDIDDAELDRVANQVIGVVQP